MTVVSLDFAAPPLHLGDATQYARRQELAGSGGFWSGESTRSLTPVLTAAATATTTSVIGAGVYVAPFHHPLSLAQEIMDLAEIAQGRLIAGVGLRAPDLLRHQTGIRVQNPIAYMRDYLRALHEAMRGVRSVRCNYRGPHFVVRFPPVAPFSFADPPPVLLAALGPQMVRLAVAEADGWILHPVHTTADTIAGWEAADIGIVREQRPFQIVSYRLIWHERWPRRLFDGLRANLAFYGMARSYKTHRERLGLSWQDANRIQRHLRRFEFTEAATFVSESIAREIVLTGSTDEIADAIAAEARFVDRLCLTLPWFGYMPTEYDAAVELLCELLPELQSAIAARSNGETGDSARARTSQQ